jgi:hypothetical protein
MNITKEQYNNLQLFYKQQPSEQQQTTVIGDDAANASLQDWSGHENFFVSFKYSTGSEKYNIEVEIDGTWAKIAQLSRERWSKENPY